jgi:16S rRNA (guanine(527)-N(7))-methyltransferase RsmG
MTSAQCKQTVPGMATSIERFSQALQLNARQFRIELTSDQAERLCRYYELLLKWNDRLHLVAPCSPEVFATRHVLESLMLLPHLPMNAGVIDVGTGAGLPLIPCLILRDDLRATLIESSQRKAAFLREARRGLRAHDRTKLLAGRFENMETPEADFLTCRALDRFSELLPALIAWAPPKTTFLLFAGESLRSQIESILPQTTIEHIPHSEERFLIVGHA